MSEKDNFCIIFTLENWSKLVYNEFLLDLLRNVIEISIVQEHF